MLINNFTKQEYKSSHVIISASQNAGALLLGDLNAVTDIEVIKKHNIRTIITAASGLQHLKIPSDLTHIVFPLMDTKQQNISAYFEICNRTIEQNLKRGAVLVHCGAGISRSASLIIAYYMKKYNQTFKNAFSYVKRIKSNVCPNLGFELQLKDYQKSLNIQSQPMSVVPNKKYSLNKNTIKLPSPYEFEIPLKLQNPKGIKDHTKNRNHIFSKTYVQKFHQKSLNINSQFLIEGRNNQNKRYQEKKNISVYQPQKYMRKKLQVQRNSFSAIKK